MRIRGELRLTPACATENGALVVRERIHGLVLRLVENKGCTGE